ncbi:MAG: class I SAM-dependent methyltransferase, partial [Planctomycetota bacterium]
ARTALGRAGGSSLGTTQTAPRPGPAPPVADAARGRAGAAPRNPEALLDFEEFFRSERRFSEADLNPIERNLMAFLAQGDAERERRHTEIFLDVKSMYRFESRQYKYVQRLLHNLYRNLADDRYADSCHAGYQIFSLPHIFRQIGRIKDESALIAELDRAVGGFSGKTLLDYGCGLALLSLQIAQRYGTHTLLVEIESMKLDFAAYNFRQAGLECVAVAVPPGGDLPELPSDCDLIFIIETLEHLYDPLASIQALEQRLRPGGHFYINNINDAYSDIPGGWGHVSNDLTACRTYLHQHYDVVTDVVFRKPA